MSKLLLASVLAIGLVMPMQASAGEMSSVSLILQKLRTAMSSTKDFDELERAGMPRESVERMRRAMNIKIKQLTDEAVDLIRAL
ncbi:MAG: hypothetical protein Q9M28_07210 [Mariprofundaceae bacterium]|nr:hypothetical protein [Mariprofundaceae bacterium]